MKKYLSLILCFLFTLQFSGQIMDSELAKATIQYRVSEESSTENEKHLETFTRKLELALQQTDDFSEFKEFRKTIDSLNINLTHYKSEKNDLTLHHLSDGFYHFNYITKNRKIILKDNRNHQYFTEIHSLNDEEFLLIKRMDEMSFSCFEAFIYHKNSQDNQFNFSNNKVLSICSWTNVDDSRTGEKDAETGLYTVEGGMRYLEPLEIKFNPKNKIISYTFYRLKDGKKVTRKAKYRGGDFKIKNYDARTFEE